MTASTRDGRSYTPEFLVAIDPAKCIGCGRCFKVCSRGVMRLVGVDEDGAFVEIDDEDDDEVERLVMTLADAGGCIGCGACARVCAKGCQQLEPAECG
ncbi:MAG: ferredoxin III, nif-specific [Pseudomonadota bacterium]